MKYLALILLVWFKTNQTSQETYVCKNAKISIYSKAPLEDIDAVSTKATSVFNAGTGDIAFSIPIKSLTFEKSLMQEHFNENYMESDKYPNATFKGKIQDKIDAGKNGVYPVTATGVLDVHGVKQNRTIPGKITVNNGVVSLMSDFNVQCKDHQIDIPQIVFKKIAETIQVKVAATYASYKKPELLIMKIYKKAVFLAAIVLPGLTGYAQTKVALGTTATDSLLKSLSADDKGDPVLATFKSTRLILTETTETIRKNNLNFLVIHRFGDIAGTDGGGKTLWGLDNSSDIYIGFEYGLTKNLDIDLAGSKYEQLLELGLKYALLRQTSDDKIPFALTVVGKTGLKPYSVSTNVYDDYTNRLNYFVQAIFARRFSSRLSLQVAPSFLRNNLPFPYIAGNQKNIFSLSAAGRLKITKRMGIVVDYAHPFSSFRDKSNNPKFYDPSGVGIEVETGGHVFTLNLTNAQAISPINYLADTQSKWTEGQYRIGFTITRVFDLNGKHKGTYK